MPLPTMAMPSGAMAEVLAVLAVLAVVVWSVGGKQGRAEAQDAVLPADGLEADAIERQPA